MNGKAGDEDGEDRIRFRQRRVAPDAAESADQANDEKFEHRDGKQAEAVAVVGAREKIDAAEPRRRADDHFAGVDRGIIQNRHDDAF